MVNDKDIADITAQIEIAAIQSGKIESGVEAVTSCYEKVYSQVVSSDEWLSHKRNEEAPKWSLSYADE